MVIYVTQSEIINQSKFRIINAKLVPVLLPLIKKKDWWLNKFQR